MAFLCFTKTDFDLISERIMKMSKLNAYKRILSIRSYISLTMYPKPHVPPTDGL